MTGGATQHGPDSAHQCAGLGGRWWFVLAVFLVLGCGNGGDAPAVRQPAIRTARTAEPGATPRPLPPVATPSAGIAPSPVGPPPERGLLLVREQDLLIRDMTTGQEYLLKRAEPGTHYAYPRWSPDGRRIAYVIQTPATGARGLDWGSNVAVSGADGRDERLVFQRPGPGTTIEGLAWTADGASLLLGVNTQEVRGSPGRRPRLTLERLDLATGHRTVLAEDAAYPDAAPDGSRIAYLTYSRDGEPDGLWTARPDGSERRLLIRYGAGQEFAGLRWPRFSPDSRRIAFGGIDAASATLPTPVCRSGWRWPWRPRVAEAHGPPVDIWVVATGGGAPQKLAELREDDPYLAWSPDGGLLAVLARCGLYQVNASDGAVARLDRGAALAQIDWR